MPDVLRSGKLRQAQARRRTPARHETVLASLPRPDSTFTTILECVRLNFHNTIVFLSTSLPSLSSRAILLIYTGLLSTRLMRATLRRCITGGRAQGPSTSLQNQYYDPRYPITETLTETFGGYRSKNSERRLPHKKTHDRSAGKRVEVVSEQLCGTFDLASKKRNLDIC